MWRETCTSRKNTPLTGTSELMLKGWWIEKWTGLSSNGIGRRSDPKEAHTTKTTHRRRIGNPFCSTLQVRRRKLERLENPGLTSTGQLVYRHQDIVPKHFTQRSKLTRKNMRQWARRGVIKGPTCQPFSECWLWTLASWPFLLLANSSQPLLFAIPN